MEALTPSAEYRVSITRMTGKVVCPVEVYRVGATVRANLRVKYVHYHMWDTILIL